MLTETIRRCSKCEQEKPLSEFYRWRTYGDGYYPSCKSCKDKLKREWMRRNPGRDKLIRRNHYLRHRASIICRTAKYTRAHPEIRRKIMLKHQYGITEEVYKTLEISQEGQCAICCIRPTNHTLFVDHCHQSKRVRGLLCRRCNSLLGFCDDNGSILKSAIRYLEENK